MKAKLLVTSVVLAAAALVVACAEHGNLDLGSDCAHGFCGDSVSFADEAGAADASADVGADAAVLMCVGTSCPAPYTTCSATAYCAVNLSQDRNNCGACGTVCAGVPQLHMGASCVKGECQYQCPTDWSNCNGLLDDGCETRLDNDPKNCGVCGHACADGSPCIDGRCGCFPPLTPCDGECVDTTSDSSNCGGCGTACASSAGPCNPMPPHTKVGCAESTCGHVICDGSWGDCDDDDDGANVCASNGCETPLNTADNCGSCGTKCGPGQECRLVDNAHMECKDTCEKSGLVKCEGSDDCIDLINDPTNCGACHSACKGARANQVDVCAKGLCEIECWTGFADCNGDPSDGCEVDLRGNAANCGACGTQCDIGAGQPCLDGKCLVVECDGGTVTK